MNESRKLGPEETLKVGDVVHVFDGAFDACVVTQAIGEKVLLERADVVLVGGSVRTRLESFWSSEQAFRLEGSSSGVYVTGASGEILNVRRK